MARATENSTRNSARRTRNIYVCVSLPFIGCHEKTVVNETDGDTSGPFRNDDNGSCSPLLQETTVQVTEGFDGGVAVTDDNGDWQVVQTTTADFDALPPGGDTSIRCVVQPPPDMLATHVCVEVGLVRSPAAAAETATLSQQQQQALPPPPSPPTIVVCSVDVEPYRKPTLQQQAVTGDNKSTERTGGDYQDDDVLDRISQDLDYLLNRKTESAATMDAIAAATDQNTKPRQDAVVDLLLQKRTKL